MNKRIKLRVTKVAAKLCGNYVDNENCLIATAAKRQFKTKHVSASPCDVTIDRILFTIGNTVQNKILRCYIRRTPEEKADPIKIRPDFRPFNIILTPV